MEKMEEQEGTKIKTEEEEELEAKKKSQVADNMDKFTTHGFIEWMGGRYKDYMETATGCEYLFALMERILNKQEVFSTIDDRIKLIRSNTKLMEENSSDELFHMIAISVSERAYEDFLEISVIYANFIEVLGAKKVDRNFQ